MRTQGGKMNRDLTLEEKNWCLEQTIAIVKEVGRGGGTSNMRDAAAALQSIYQTLYTLRLTIKEGTEA
jgi:hypothetical protein